MESAQFAIKLPAGTSPADPDEILRGAEKIGQALGLTKHEANYHLRAGHIRGVRKLGKGYIGIRREVVRLNAAPEA
jgi:hypothetical protein